MMRRATPDSEALASSEDERPWPSSSFGSLPRRRESAVPGLGGIWAAQSRPDFAPSHRLSARASTVRSVATPSPAASDSSAANLPFSIPLQPTAKAGRSLSHSQGQRDPADVQNAPNEHAPVLPLGLLAEEVDTDPDSDSIEGERLTQTTSHPPIGALQRSYTYSTPYHEMHHSNGRNGGYDSHHDAGDRYNGNGVGGLHDHPARRTLWQSSLGWDDMPTINESRRHSLADIPTRRGSLAGADHHYSDANGGARVHRSSHAADMHGFDHSPAYTNTTDPNDLNEAMHRATIGGRGGRSHRDPQPPHNTYVPPTGARNDSFMRGHTDNRSLLYIVQFKCARAEPFYTLPNTGLDIKPGDNVIVEADRGQDLGYVTHARVTHDEAKIELRALSEEQYKWLMMFSGNNAAGRNNPNGGNLGMAMPDTYNSFGTTHMPRPPRSSFENLRPRAIKRMASPHEVEMLKDKEGNEAKAKRTCTQKAQSLHLDMEILDAEFQWDFQKLIFYYYADHYINFKDLITELYKIYKCRLWFSAVNPASFSQNAMGEPPSGMGPGAITGQANGNGTGANGGYNGGNEVNNNYDMAYGADPDPYGAVPPYRIGGYVNPTNPEGQGPSSHPSLTTSPYGGFRINPAGYVAPHAHMPPGTYPAPFQTQPATPAPTVNHLPGIGFSAAPSPMTQTRTPYSGYNGYTSPGPSGPAQPAAYTNTSTSNLTSAYPQSSYPVFGQAAAAPTRSSAFNNNNNNNYLGPMGAFSGRRLSTQAPIGTRAPATDSNRHTGLDTFGKNGGLPALSGPAASEFVPGVVNAFGPASMSPDFHPPTMSKKKDSAASNGDVNN